MLHSRSQNGNLRDCQMKNLGLLLQQIKVFLQNWYGIILEYDYNLAAFTPKKLWQFFLLLMN